MLIIFTKLLILNTLSSLINFLVNSCLFHHNLRSDNLKILDFGLTITLTDLEITSESDLLISTCNFGIISMPH